MKKLFKTISVILFVVMGANFTTFFIIGLALGGSALNGKVEQGHYYLGDHGKMTEVSEQVWNYSYCHSVSVFITHPLGIGSMWLADKFEKLDAEV